MNNLDDIEDYEKLGVTNFLFPLRNYSIGYEDFTFEELGKIERDVYILANRLLTDSDLDAFEKLVIPKNVRGFIIEDTGLYTLLKDKGYILISFQNHLNANYRTCNYWLDYFDSLVISTDITYEEIDTNLNKAKKPLVFYTVGSPMIMYSRRHLVSNYYLQKNLSPKKEVAIADPKGEFTFRLKETNYGTACFDTRVLDAREEATSLDDEKILFYLIDTESLTKEEVVSALKGESLKNTTKGFLEKKTVYRIGDLK